MIVLRNLDHLFALFKQRYGPRVDGCQLGRRVSW